MVSEQQLRDEVSIMLNGLGIPPVPLASIRSRIDARSAAPVSFLPPRVLAVAASIALIAAIAAPLVAPGLTQSVEERVAQILHWSPPQAPLPSSLRPALRGRLLDLSAAQNAVDFPLVAPVGLPKSTIPAWIRLASTGVYSAKTQSWAIGSKYVEFGYRRSDGGTFTLAASSAASLTEPPSRYVLEERGTDKDGNPVIVRRQRFVWRNGAQVMTAIVGDQLSAADILTIRETMRGVPVATVWPPKPSHGAVIRLR